MISIKMFIILLLQLSKLIGIPMSSNTLFHSIALWYCIDFWSRLSFVCLGANYILVEYCGCELMIQSNAEIIPYIYFCSKTSLIVFIPIKIFGRVFGKCLQFTSMPNIAIFKVISFTTAIAMYSSLRVALAMCSSSRVAHDVFLTNMF